MKDNLHVAGIHMALDILRFAVFFMTVFVKQAELGVPHSKSKLSWPIQKFS